MNRARCCRPASAANCRSAAPCCSAADWNRPDLDAEVFDDGWFRTGDVAYLDDEGYLFIVDRIKDLIIRGGENIGCGHGRRPRC
jgi:acyl-CoA synthetase (AMP-forming)/AMP-acid ligase II